MNTDFVSIHPRSGWQIEDLYWRWKETLALISLDLASPFLPAMGLRLPDPNAALPRIRSIVETTLTGEHNHHDQPHVLIEVRHFLVDLASQQSTDGAYSLYCVAMRGRPSNRISESLHAWNKVFTLPPFFEYLKSNGAGALAEVVRQYLDEGTTLTRRVNAAVGGNLSDWDRHLIDGGYYDDPTARFYPEALIDDIIRWRNMRRLWIAIAAGLGRDKLIEVKRFAQSLLPPDDVWPRLHWPEGDALDSGL